MVRPIVTRRDFLRGTASAAAWAFMLSCTPNGGTFAPIRPRAGADPVGLDTRWPIKHVIYLMLENRSFDHLFGAMPRVNGTTVGVDLGRERPLIRAPSWLPGDLPHDYAAARKSLNGGKMDGFALGTFGPMYGYSQFQRQDIPSYWHWAERFVLSDNCFASALGPSYPNHLYYIAGQSGGAIDNPENIKIDWVEVEGRRLFLKSWGIDAIGDEAFVFVEDDRGNLTKHNTTFDIPTVGEQLTERGIDWAYYAPQPHQPGYIWQAYSAIPNVYGTELWDRHMAPVDDVVMDIEAGALPSVSWVVPRWQLSDHPPASTCHAHDWVTGVVNAVMESDLWEQTAIFLTWDEWGGLYDHVAPPVVNGRSLGMRVPMLVISPYAKEGYVDDGLADFVSPLRFVADNWDLPYLTDRYEAVHNYEHVFDFDREPRPPDPQPKLNCAGTAWDFPDTDPAWPPGIEPQQPNFPPEKEYPEI